MAHIPISKRARELFSDPEAEERIAQAIREGRARGGIVSTTVPIDGSSVTLTEVGSGSVAGRATGTATSGGQARATIERPKAAWWHWLRR